ncbi:MAG: DNA polymerase, partial [Myxococcota bacterium]
ADPARPKTVHGASDLYTALGRAGVEVDGVALDTAAASHLDDPIGRAPHDLEVVARAVLRRALPSTEGCRGKGKSKRRFAELDPERVAAFAGARARAVGELADRFGAPGPHHATAMRLARTLAAMQRRGIACRPERLDEAETWLLAHVGRLEAEVHELAGRRFNLGSSKQLSTVLFEELGLEPPIRTKTGFSTATEALLRIQHAHPVVPRVMAWRQHRRLVDAWVTALRPAIDGDGRVRARQHLARSFFGRVLCSDPDLSRVPGRTEAMSWIRRAFAPPEGTVLLSIDYAQLGLVVLAHLSGDPRLTAPIEQGADLHRITASALFEVEPEVVSSDQRQTAKAVNFATFNGQGPSALAAQLGISIGEARTFIGRFDAYYAVARDYQEAQLEQARTTGEVESWSGRRWRVRGLESLEVRDRAYAERLARRAAIEGTVADVTRRGLLLVDEAFRRAGLVAAPLVQVHDEILFEVPDGELGEAVELGCRVLEGVADLDVPLRVGAKAGPDWASLVPVGG